MNELDKISLFLQDFPLWRDVQLQTDGTDAAPENMGLFPRGQEEYARQEDVTGTVTVSCRSRYLLRRVAQCRNEENARWLHSLAEWVRQESALGRAPALGSGHTRIRAENGKLKTEEQAGTAIYEIDLIAEYEIIYEGV